jgi:spoIIIJ-associated protein
MNDRPLPPESRSGNRSGPPSKTRPEGRRPDARRTSHPEQSRELPLIDFARAAEEMKRFIDIVVREMQLAIEYEIVMPSGEAPGGGPSAEDAGMVISFRGADQDLLLERNAEFLLALEHLAHRWLRLDPRQHDRVRFDCGDYRATHLEELKLSARVAAQRVRETGQAFWFNPMSSRERRLIHLELHGAQGVRTASEGSGDRRQLVIYPAEKNPRSS